MLLARWLLISGRELESCAGVSWILNDSSGIEFISGRLNRATSSSQETLKATTIEGEKKNLKGKIKRDRIRRA